MEEYRNELTFKDIWYRYLIPFFKWFGRSIKKTFTSKRLIAVVGAVIIVPLIAWGVFEFQTKKEIEADTLLRSDTSFILNVDASKINVPIGENGISTSRESYALVVAKEQLSKYSDAITGDELLGRLYNNVEIRNNSACLYENMDSLFSSIYIGDKAVDGVITRDYFIWVISNYFSVSIKNSGSFSVSIISNRARYYSDYLLSKETVKEPTSDYEKKQLTVRKLWPLLSIELMDSINKYFPSIIMDENNGLLSLMDTTTMLENPDGTTTEVDYVKSLEQISSPATYTVTDPNTQLSTEFTVNNGVSWAIGGFFIGVGIFLIIDMIIAIVEGDRKYRGVETAEIKPKKNEEVKSKE